MAGFEVIFIAIGVVAIAAALASVFVGGNAYESIGRGGMSLRDEEPPAEPPAGSAAAQAEAEAEVRQFVEAKSARREARGEPPLDVEAEVAALTRPAAPTRDDALREEVRQIVVARNERRIARGEPPLEVEAEVDRQLRDIGA